MIVPEIKFAEKDGFSIAYQVWGEGTETLIYVPGMISHLDVSAESPEYVSFLSRLSENYRVIIFDKRGQGLSDRDSTVPGIESRMDDIEAVADAEKVKSFYLFGYSEGASIALLYAATHPEKTLGVSVFGGFPKFLNSQRKWGTKLQEGEKKKITCKKNRDFFELSRISTIMIL